jgi:DNA polymerase-3 subunit epsilon
MKNTRIAKLHPDFRKEILDELPEEPGVYYFFNDLKKLIYIGKSKDIRQRVMTHLSNNSSRRAMEMRDAIADISWEETGSELIALLKESEEIKDNKPVYNRAQRRTGFHWGIYHYSNKKGYICFEAKNIKHNDGLLSVFSSKERVRKKLSQMVEKYQLCQKLCGLYESKNECFHFQVGLCKGACCNEENAASYNMRAKSALDDFVFSQENFFLIDQGRNINEKSAVRIIKGKYSGYGFFDINEVGFGLTAIHDCIKTSQDNRDIQVILKTYLKRNEVERVIRF